MITLRKKKIEGIPLMECVSDQAEELVLPTIVLFHGFDSRKEAMMNWAVELCRKGMRVLTPDALYHGERNKANRSFDDLWTVVDQNVQDCATLYDTYRQRGLVKGFAVGGQSMGGMTTVSALIHHEFIDAAACLMGTLDPVAYTVWAREAFADRMNLLEPRELFDVLGHLRYASLLERPDGVKGRPFYIWHDQDDPLVPIRYSKETFQRYQTSPAFQATQFHETSGHGHHVPFHVVAEASRFLAEALKGKEVK